jgi:uncharacterized membrane protein
MRHRLTIIAALLGSAVFLVPGVWAFFWPHSFHREIADFDPFNLHLFHDLGAFQIGIGIALLGAVLWRDALAVSLLAGTVGAAVHTVSHVMDRDLGGSAGDPWTLGAITLVLAIALAFRAARPGPPWSHHRRWAVRRTWSTEGRTGRRRDRAGQGYRCKSRPRSAGRPI